MGTIKTDNFRTPANTEKTTPTASSTIMEFGLDALAATLHESAIEKGFWDGEISFDKVGNKLALVHSEVTEVLEAIRKDKGSHAIVEEIADVIIRLLDVYAALRNDKYVEDSLDDVLDFKIDKNKARPRLHGNLF
jgi:NTP pyrophosphatase (non-canonical NTP hydrolase)